MSFDNMAFLNPEQANEQFKNWVTSFQVKQGWSAKLVSDWVLASDTIYDASKAWYMTDKEETTKYWKLMLQNAPIIFDENSNGDPTIIPKYNEFMTVLASASDTSYTFDQGRGIKGQAKVASEQAEEMAQDFTKAVQKGNSLLPYYMAGAIALFVAIKAFK
jgi:hypothetical protein